MNIVFKTNDHNTRNKMLVRYGLLSKGGGLIYHFITWLLKGKYITEKPLFGPRTYKSSNEVVTKVYGSHHKEKERFFSLPLTWKYLLIYLINNI